MKLLIASTSRSKVREIRSVLSSSVLQLVTLDQIGRVAAPPETGSSFQENARLKASAYRRATGFPALADDSGLEVDALGGAPGVRSARFAPTRAERIARVLAGLAHLTGPEDRSRRTARFVCSICIDWGDGLTEATGLVKGEIALEPAGESGFGYDPIFYYPPLGRTFAEISPEEKNQISHRASALRRLSRELRRRGVAPVRQCR